jgi:hypothetical protein
MTGTKTTPEIVIFATIGTLAWVMALTRLRSFWRYDPASSDFIELTRRRRIGTGFVRAVPSANIAAGFLLGAAWIGIATNASQNLAVAVPELLLGLGLVVFFVAYLTTWIYGRPRFLVPPKLRVSPNSGRQ